MKKTKLFLKMVVLAMVGALMSGCAEEIDALLSANQSVIQKTTISLADDTSTRGAIAADGKTSFSVNDQIAVIYQNTSDKTVKAVSAALTGTDLIDGGASATFTVELKSPKAGTKVRYIYPASMAATTIAEDVAPDAAATVNTAGLATQDGTLATLANDYGLAVYDGTMSTSATLPTGADVILKNQLAILKLQSIKINPTTEIRSQITNLTIDDGTNAYTVNRTAVDAPIFVAMQPTTGDITISTTVSGISYTKTATAETLESNKIYPVNLTMAPDFLATPLTVEAAVAGATMTFDINTSAATNPIYYSTNGTEWTEYTDNTPITLTNVGDIVQFRGDNARYATGPGTSSNISFSDNCYVYGNIMSLITSTDFSTETTLTGSYSFYYLFYDNSHLLTDASRPLLLPATTLADYCYDAMFEGCTELITAPELPATTLANDCYRYMFCYCTKLTTAPELPATTLADYCYDSMFEGCTELITAPELPATTLAKGCYYYMFSGCSKLATAPELPATTLANECYMYMFTGCTKLSSVTCLATNISADDCLSSWLYEAGTDDGCERIVYVDPTMLAVGTDDNNGEWRLADSGEDGKRWSLSNKDFLSLTSADIGKVLGANGCIYANATAATTAGTAAEAMIAYVGSATGEEAYNFTHGLALALSDANSGNACKWKTENTDAGHTKQTSNFTSESGLQYNDATHNTDTYPAFKAAIANNGTAAPTGCSAWFLPTAYQWNQMINACKNVLGTNNNFTDLRDGFNLQSGYYWSSSESLSNIAWEYNFYDGSWKLGSKDNGNYVRSALAF